MGNKNKSNFQTTHSQWAGMDRRALESELQKKQKMIKKYEIID